MVPGVAVAWLALLDIHASLGNSAPGRIVAFGGPADAGPLGLVVVNNPRRNYTWQSLPRFSPLLAARGPIRTTKSCSDWLRLQRERPARKSHFLICATCPCRYSIRTWKHKDCHRTHEN